MISIIGDDDDDDDDIARRRLQYIMIMYVGLSLFTTQPLSRSPTSQRRRRTVRSIMMELGPYYTRRAYRMEAISFWKMHRLIYRKMRYNSMPDETSKKKHKNGARNGLITSAVCLSCAIRYFAGGAVYDIAVAHGVSVRQVYYSVWRVVDAINNTAAFDITFPSHDKQNQIAEQFKSKSQAGFDNLVGCIDGMLLWTESPLPSCCAVCGFGAKNFFCGRKKKFGLNLTGTVDDKRRFIDLDIQHPEATSDYLAFAQSPLNRRIQEGLLADGKYLFGDNAYVNTMYMATPYKKGNSLQDNYNYFHSQLRITVECAFGMLVQRWAILRRALPAAFGLRKITQLTLCLCKLHNFLIDERIEKTLPRDMLHLRSQGNIVLEPHSTFSEETVPTELLHGGDHFDDVGNLRTTTMRREAYQSRRDGTQLPRDVLKQSVTEQGLVRPTPKNW